MPNKRFKSKQIVTLLWQLEVSMANRKRSLYKPGKKPRSCDLWPQQ